MSLEDGVATLGSSNVIAFVATTDLARSRPFYVDTLGLTVVDESPYACVIDAGGTMLRLTPARKVARASYTVLGWRVADIDATVRSLREKGVVFQRYRGMPLDELGVWTTPEGSKVAWFKDPDGNLLSLTQFATPSI